MYEYAMRCSMFVYTMNANLVSKIVVDIPCLFTYHSMVNNVYIIDRSLLHFKFFSRNISKHSAHLKNFRLSIT